jgi:hypothetical protein
MMPPSVNRLCASRYAVVQTNTRAIVAAFIPGGVMRYLLPMIATTYRSHEETSVIDIGPIRKNVKMRDGYEWSRSDSMAWGR